MLIQKPRHKSSIAQKRCHLLHSAGLAYQQMVPQAAKTK